MSDPQSLAIPHGIAMDSEGAIYVAEATYSMGVRSGRTPPDCHSFLKIVPGQA